LIEDLSLVFAIFILVVCALVGFFVLSIGNVVEIILFRFSLFEARSQISYFVLVPLILFFILS